MEWRKRTEDNTPAQKIKPARVDDTVVVANEDDWPVVGQIASVHHENGTPYWVVLLISTGEMVYRLGHELVVLFRPKETDDRRKP